MLQSRSYFVVYNISSANGNKCQVVRTKFERFVVTEHEVHCSRRGIVSEISLVFFRVFRTLEHNLARAVTAAILTDAMG